MNALLVTLGLVGAALFAGTAAASEPPQGRGLLPPTPKLGPQGQLPDALPGEPPNKTLQALQIDMWRALESGVALRRRDYNASDWGQLGILADAHYNR